MRLRIGRISVSGVPAGQGPQAERVLRAALGLLAERLRAAPLRAGADAEAAAIAVLQSGAVPPRVLFGPGGAERLAEMLYLRLRAQRGAE
jgi:hypothetical protein